MEHQNVQHKKLLGTVLYPVQEEIGEQVYTLQIKKKAHIIMLKQGLLQENLVPSFFSAEFHKIKYMGHGIQHHHQRLMSM